MRQLVKIVGRELSATSGFPKSAFKLLSMNSNEWGFLGPNLGILGEEDHQGLNINVTQLWEFFTHKTL